MPEQAVAFAFADPERRTFAALNRAGDGYHWVHPAEADDVRVTGRRLDNGEWADPIVELGHLVCECKGGRYRGTCYVVEAALDLLTTSFEAVAS